MSATPVIVTAASSNHCGALLQMLASLRPLNARVECYDLGLTAAEVRSLPQWNGLTHHTFDYTAYPPHMNVAVAAGEYAWKPVIIAEVVDRVRAAGEPRDVLWADAGCFFHALEPIGRRIAESGLWVRSSAGTMREWTHPAMFEYLAADPAQYADRPNADATLVGLAVASAPPDRQAALYRDIVEPWKTCAMVKACIAPDGSSRRNHRQDQSVLSYLVHRAGYAFATDTPGAVAIRSKCDRWFYHYIGFDVPPSLYARTCLA